MKIALDPHRVSISEDCSTEELSEILPTTTRVDIEAPRSRAAAKLLARALSECRTLEVGIHGFHDTSLAIDFLVGLPITHLGISHQIESLEPLAGCPNITSLSLGWTLRNKSLHPLSAMKELRSISLTGPARDIEAIGSLGRLETANFRSMRFSTLEVLAGLKKLSWLWIGLGSASSLNGIEHLPRLRYLELWNINKLEDFTAIAECVNLRAFLLQGFSKPFVLPSLANLTKLDRIDLLNVKGMSSLRPIAACKSLQELVVTPSLGSHGSGSSLVPSDYRCLKNHPSLRTIAAYKRAEVLREAGLSDTSPVVSMFSKWRSK